MWRIQWYIMYKTTPPSADNIARERRYTIFSMIRHAIRRYINAICNKRI
jgi:hypothetical protein